MAPKTDFPPVRACLFDMDGLILNTEDLYTKCINEILAEYNRPSLPWSIKAKLQGRPGPASHKIFWDWAQLPISTDEYFAKFTALQRSYFPSAAPLPGAETLLEELSRTRYWETSKAGSKSAESEPNSSGASVQPHQVHLALATSSMRSTFDLKTKHLAPLFSLFPLPQQVLGDDKRIPAGKGKPLPHIYLLALQTINDALSPNTPKITPEECLVFEDSVPGVESGRRAGMRVIWCPHPKLKEEYTGREAEVLAGRTGEAGDIDLHQVGELDDGWAEYLPSLENFPYDKYGIIIPPKSVNT